VGGAGGEGGGAERAAVADECPPDSPSPGTPCAEGLLCRYQIPTVACLPHTITAQCQDEEWRITGDYPQVPCAHGAGGEAGAASEAGGAGGAD
jgi:hypothetical protein